MANTAKTTAKGSKTVSEDKNLFEENELLKKQMAEMQSQMELLMKQMSESKQFIKEEKPKSKKEKSIAFVNMTQGTIVLRGSQLWSIEGQFKTRKFTEREAIIILNNMNKLIRSGAVYIADADFIEENDLLDAYQYILSNKDLETLFEKDAEYVVEAYKMVSDEQKKIIVDMIIDRKIKGLNVDGNILMKIGKLSGKDLMNIEPLED